MIINIAAIISCCKLYIEIYKDVFLKSHQHVPKLELSFQIFTRQLKLLTTVRRS